MIEQIFSRIKTDHVEEFEKFSVVLKPHYSNDGTIRIRTIQRIPLLISNKTEIPFQS